VATGAGRDARILALTVLLVAASQVFKMRGVLAGNRRVASRRGTHTRPSKPIAASTCGASTRSTTTDWWGLVAPQRTPCGAPAADSRAASSCALRWSVDNGVPVANHAVAKTR
jgi:hypothetical protein